MKKNRTLWFAASLGLGMLVMMSSCNNDDDNPITPPVQTIPELVGSSTSLTLLNAAVARAGVGAALGGPNLTVFAPSDDAFRAAGFADVAAVNAAPADTLKRILENHVLSTRQAAVDIPTASNTELNALGGGKLYVTKATDGAISVNGAKVTTADGAASNGVIHIIDRVLVPARGNIVQTILADSANYSLLAAAVTRASSGATNVAGVLNGAGPYTVFAPTNAAFAATPYSTVALINAANPDSLARILSYHVVSGRAFSSNLVAGTQATLGGNVTVAAVDNGFSIGGVGNGTTPARVTLANSNKLATNGVIHQIDRVILP